MAVLKQLVKVASKKKLVGDYWQLALEFPDRFDFLAGQYVSLKVDEAGIRRSYSIASKPNGKMIDLLVNVGPMGVGSRYVLGLKEGDGVEVLAPVGKFVVDESKMMNGKNKLFIATGSGIAPFRSMVMDLLTRGFKDQIRLV
ncbi:hypothetical protein HY333_00025, partial [Candidatus Collierbacteria bacterium]|nr:hypothetical protein [Candidatus Collierbacteria bacterium]